MDMAVAQARTSSTPLLRVHESVAETAQQARPPSSIRVVRGALALGYLAIFVGAVIGILAGCSAKTALVPVLGATLALTAFSAAYVAERRRLTYKHVEEAVLKPDTQEA